MTNPTVGDLLTGIAKEYGIEVPELAECTVKRLIQIHDLVKELEDRVRMDVIKSALDDGFTGHIKYSDSLWEMVKDED